MSVSSPRSSRFLASVCSPIVVAVILLLVSPVPALAQSEKQSHWGVSFYSTPSWEINERFRKLFFEEDENGVMEGSEVAIGFVRGRTLSGDWGASFVRKPFKDTSGALSEDMDCFNQAQTICKPHTEETRFSGVYLNAFEVHKFIAFATIKKRAQIGLNVAGGLGTMNGNVVKTTDRFEPTGFNQQGPTGYKAIHEEEVNLAKDELLPYFPLFKLEVVGAAIVAPMIKVKVAYGLNLPGNSLRVSGVYLIGAK